MVDLPPRGLPSNAFGVYPIVPIPIPLAIDPFLVYNVYSEDALPTNPTFEPFSVTWECHFAHVEFGNLKVYQLEAQIHFLPRK